MSRLEQLRMVMLTVLLAGCGASERRAPDTYDPFLSIAREFPHLADVSGKWSTCELLNLSGAAYLTPAFTLLYDDLTQIPQAARSLCSALINDTQHPETLLCHCFRLLGVPAGGFGPPLPGRRVPDREFDYTLQEGSQSDWEMLPVEFRSDILRFLQGWMEAEEVLQQFLSPMEEVLSGSGALQKDQYLEQLMEPWRKRGLSRFTYVDLIGKADLRKLSLASRVLASSLTNLTGHAGVVCPEGFRSCILETASCRLRILGAGSDTIKCSNDLIIDLGGDDLYRGNIASPFSPDQSVAVVIDFAGDDTYLSEDGYLVNGCLGIGMLFDLSGNDLYCSDKAGMASSSYGTSMLYDLHGDDRYVSRSAYSQGAGHLGVALLVDLEGDDLYECSGYSQGYGGTLGTGALVDLAGDDHYNLGNDTVSFVQGAGRGRWAEASDGHSLGGGTGIFVDGGGSDHYQAGSFSQGASYFTGMGFFMDLEGDDRYLACSHSQGYAAHFSLACFMELKGDDMYNEGSDYLQITQLLGNGRDLSAGWFIEEEGDDRYHFGNRSAGIGDLNGVGILWDRKGQDSYTWHRNGVNAGSLSMGQTIALTEGMATGFRLLAPPHIRRMGILKDEHGSRRITVQIPGS